MGFTEATLQEHVATEHVDTLFEVVRIIKYRTHISVYLYIKFVIRNMCDPIILLQVCPVCASIPGADPNNMTDDFAGHLSLEHRSGPRDLISFLDDSSSSRHNGRRLPHTSRGVGGARPRRYICFFNIYTD